MEWLMVMIETEEIREVKTNAQVGTKDKEEGWCVEGEEVVAAGIGGFCCLCCLCSRTSLRLSFFLIAHHDDMPSSFSCFVAVGVVVFLESMLFAVASATVLFLH